MLLSVSKWRRILRGETETKSAPKTIFSGNGNGLKNFIFLSTQEQKNVHTVYAKQDRVDMCVLQIFIIIIIIKLLFTYPEPHSSFLWIHPDIDKLHLHKSRHWSIQNHSEVLNNKKELSERLMDR